MNEQSNNFKQIAAAVLTIFIFIGGRGEPHDAQKKIFPVPRINLSPHKYVIYKTDQQIHIDGKLDEKAWGKTAWTSDFVDIEDTTTADPSHRTRAKLLWNGNYLYVGAELKENDVWATMTERNSPLFLDNAFEIFIDPDGDTHNYLEFEINALSTIWDILLTRPGRDGGSSFSQYNVEGLKASVYVDGKINDPDDADDKWTLEVAFPMDALKELIPHRNMPKDGDQWRVQLARAERQLEVIDGRYRIKKNHETNSPIPPNYWSWAPQGLVNLHYPEMWGFVQFSDKITGSGKDDFAWNRDEEIKWALRKVYYRLKEYQLNHGSYTENLSGLDLRGIKIDDFDFTPSIQATSTMFEVSSGGFGDKRWFINQNGRVWYR